MWSVDYSGGWKKKRLVAAIAVEGYFWGNVIE